MEDDLIQSESEALDTGLEPGVKTLLVHCEPCHSKKLIFPSGYIVGDDILPEASGVLKANAERKRKRKLWDVPLRPNLPRRAKDRAIILMTGVLHGIKIKRDIAIPQNPIRRRRIEKIFLKKFVRAKNIQTRRAKNIQKRRGKNIQTRRVKHIPTRRAKKIQSRRVRIPESSSDSSYSSYS